MSWHTGRFCVELTSAQWLWSNRHSGARASTYKERLPSRIRSKETGLMRLTPPKDVSGSYHTHVYRLAPDREFVLSANSLQVGNAENRPCRNGTISGSQRCWLLRLKMCSTAYPLCTTRVELWLRVFPDSKYIRIDLLMKPAPLYYNSEQHRCDQIHRSIPS